MLAVDQNDLGKFVWHTQSLHKSLNGGAFMHVQLQT
jgi:hypothetical protein